jgi:serine/threonine-protein kinase/endoribonuclease IRE1
MCRDPKDPDLLALEENAQSIIGNDWHSRMDRVFMENLGKYRKYDGKSVQDLLRALRNKVRFFNFLLSNCGMKNLCD